MLSDQSNVFENWTTTLDIIQQQTSEGKRDTLIDDKCFFHFWTRQYHQVFNLFVIAGRYPLIGPCKIE